MIYMDHLAKIISNPMTVFVFIFETLTLHSQLAFGHFTAREVNIY